MRRIGLIGLIGLITVAVASAEWPRAVTTVGTVTTNDVVVYSDVTGQKIKSGGSVSNLAARVTAPASNTAAGSLGQWALSLTGGTNYLYFYDSNGAGVGTGRWLRIECSVTW